MRSPANVATISFTGAATAHAAANGGTVNITFLNAALTGGNTAAIAGLNPITLAIGFTDPVIPPPSPPPVAPSVSGGAFSGSVGLPFGAALNAGGNPTPAVSVRAGALPPGITLTGGNLSGIPTETGKFTFTVAATNSEGTATAELTVTIGPAVPLVTGVSPSLGTFGSTVTISGYNLGSVNSVSIGGVPALSFSVMGGSIVAVVGAGGTGSVNVSTPLGSSSGGSFTFEQPNPPMLDNVAIPTVLTGDDNFTIIVSGRNIPIYTSVSITPITSNGAAFGTALPGQVIATSTTNATILLPLAARFAGLKRLTLRIADIAVSTTFAVVYGLPPIAGELSVSSTVATGLAFTTVVSGSGFFRTGYVRVLLNGTEVGATVADGKHVNINIPGTMNERDGTVNIRLLNSDGQFTTATVQIIGQKAPFIGSVTPSRARGSLTFIVRGVAFSPRITAMLGRRQVTVLRATETELEISVPPDYEAPTIGAALFMVENPDGKRYGFLIGAPLFAPSADGTFAEEKNGSILANSTASRTQANTSNHALYEEFRLTPNPASDALTLETRAFTGVGRLQIMNMRGEEIISGEIVGNSIIGTRQTLDIRALPSGVYVVRFAAGVTQAAQQIRIVR